MKGSKNLCRPPPPVHGRVYIQVNARQSSAVNMITAATTAFKHILILPPLR